MKLKDGPTSGQDFDGTNPFMSQSSAFGGGKKKGKTKGEVNFSQTNHGVSGISNMTGITGVSTKTGGIPDESMR
jgi:hypothetical protein